MSDEEIEWLQTADVRAFLADHADDDPAALALRSPPAPGWNVRLLAQQVRGRQQARRKLPSWLATPGVVYPDARALAQCSSERLALWKAGLLGGAGHVGDLTGGFGVDATCFAKGGRRVTYVERQPDLARLARHNGALLRADVDWRTGDGPATWPERADFLYLDPDRRDGSRRIVALEACRPDVVALRGELLRRAPVLLVKAAPGLDLDRATHQLPGTTDVWVVALAGEVKEVLLRVTPSPPAPPRIHAVHLRGAAQETLTFSRAEEADVSVRYSAPDRFVYEPHGALLKAGAFRTVAARYGVDKLHPNSHLYTSAGWVADFPGRAWRVEAVTTLNRREIKRHFPDGRAHVLTRNFPLTVAQIRKKTGLGESETRSLLATTGPDGKAVVIVGVPLRLQ